MATSELTRESRTLSAVERFNRDDLISSGGILIWGFASQTLHDLRAYYEVVETFLTSVQAERRQAMVDNMEILSPQIRQDVERSRYKERWDQLFPSELRTSLITSVMSFLEKHVNDVSEGLAKVQRTSVTHRDMRGSGIPRARIFLTRICRLSLPSNKQWDEVNELLQLRNMLVHNAGVLEAVSERRRVLELKKRLPGIAYTDDGGFELQRELCMYALDTSDRFVSALTGEVKRICTRTEAFAKKHKS